MQSAIGTRGWLSLLLLLASLLFLGVTHRGTMLGDDMFRALGIPAWSNPSRNEGLHYAAIFGLVLFIVAARLAVREFRTRYKLYVGRSVLIGCIAFFCVFPLLTEQAMRLMHRHHTGLAVVDVAKKDSRCNYGTEHDIVSVRCTVRLLNYGASPERVKIRPLLQNRGSHGIWSFAEVSPAEITMPPRSNLVYNVQFESKPDDRVREYSASGMTHSFGVQFIKDGRKKEVYTQ